MTLTVKMFSPAQSAGFNVTAASGANYVADANGLITATAGDVASLMQAGCQPLADRPVVQMTTAGAVVEGSINVIPSSAASTVAYALTLAAPTVVGLRTTILQPAQSTAGNTVTCSSLCSFASGGTVLTNSSAMRVDLDALGSTSWAISNCGFLGSSLVVANPASS